MTRMDEITEGIRTVGVIGMGTMGAGIVQTCLMSGYPVVAWDADEVALITTWLEAGMPMGAQ